MPNESFTATTTVQWFWWNDKRGPAVAAINHEPPARNHGAWPCVLNSRTRRPGAPGARLAQLPFSDGVTWRDRGARVPRSPSPRALNDGFAEAVTSSMVYRPELSGDYSASCDSFDELVLGLLGGVADGIRGGGRLARAGTRPGCGTWLRLLVLAIRLVCSWGDAWGVGLDGCRQTGGEPPGSG